MDGDVRLHGIADRPRRHPGPLARRLDWEDFDLLGVVGRQRQRALERGQRLLVGQPEREQARALRRGDRLEQLLEAVLPAVVEPAEQRLLHFLDFGIKKLVSTSYAADSKPAADYYQPTLFETADPKFDPAKTRTRGKRFTLEAKDINGDGIINIDDLQWEYLQGDGDFRSPEVKALRDEADIVITNPPFSKLREFVAWLVEGAVQFAFIGNNHAITYKEIFPLIRGNSLWKGATGNTTDMVFGVPKGSDIKEADRLKAERLGYLRHWFAEHHGMPSIASSSPELLIEHVASATERITEECPEVRVVALTAHDDRAHDDPWNDRFERDGVAASCHVVAAAPSAPGSGTWRRACSGRLDGCFGLVHRHASPTHEGV